MTKREESQPRNTRCVACDKQSNYRTDDIVDQAEGALNSNGLV
jgi:hypothetical protein